MNGILAYKAFNSKLQATMGRGTFQFEPGKTYEEPECKCAHNGFHCAENPLCVLTYYSDTSSRYFIVDAAGDINQDAHGSRISCTKITLVKEINRIELATHACLYIQRYPKRKMESGYAVMDSGECRDGFIIVRGKNPKAKGQKGTYLFLMQEQEDTEDIAGIYPVYIDGKEYHAGKLYGIEEGEICEKVS